MGKIDRLFTEKVEDALGDEIIISVNLLYQSKCKIYNIIWFFARNDNDKIIEDLYVKVSCKNKFEFQPDYCDSLNILDKVMFPIPLPNGEVTFANIIIDDNIHFNTVKKADIYEYCFKGCGFIPINDINNIDKLLKLVDENLIHEATHKHLNFNIQTIREYADAHMNNFIEILFYVYTYLMDKLMKSPQEQFRNANIQNINIKTYII